jgi:pimeloyl-ACP methyl ester carboxylesterase
MIRLALRPAAIAAILLEGLCTLSCVDVPYQAPFTKDQFTVAEFDPTTGKVPFPILSPCNPAQVNPGPPNGNGACTGQGTFACANPACSAGRVALPITACQQGQTPCTAPGVPANCTPCDSPVTTVPLKTGLNTLDGFSTYASLKTTFDKPVDPASVSKQTAFLLDQSGNFADFEPTLVTLDAGQSYQSYALFLQPSRPPSGSLPANTAVKPLAPKAPYIAVLTTGILSLNKDAQGHQIPIEPDRTFALLRARTPLANPDGTPIQGSLLAELTPDQAGCSGTAAQIQACLDATRATLEATRQAFNVLLLKLEAGTPPLPREKIALLWPVLTQSIWDELVGIRAGILATGTVIPPAMSRSRTIPGQMILGPNTAVQSFHFGCVRTPMFLQKPTGTFQVDAQGNIRVTPGFIPYVVSVPSAAPPATGYKVAIFSHDLGRWRYDMIGVANALAAGGYAVVAIDHPFHGDRTNMVLPNRGASPPDNGSMVQDVTACEMAIRLPTNPEAAGTGAQCPANAPADPITGDCQGGATKIPSGQNMLSPANLFGTRDNFRQSAIDLMQLVQGLRLFKRAGSDTPEFDVTQIAFVGQGLGGMVGTPFLATEPIVKVGVLNAAGGGIVNILRETQNPNLCSPVVTALRFVGICTPPSVDGGMAGPCDCQATAAYIQFGAIAQWILDRADAINYAYNLIERPLWCDSAAGPTLCGASGAGAPLAKKILLQKIADDDVIPNSTTYALRGAVGPKSCYRELSGAPPDGGSPHGFLINPQSPAVVDAQTQMASFIASGGATTKVQGGTASDACP